MDLKDRDLRTIYWACKRAIERVDQLKDRQALKTFHLTVRIELADYIDLGNRIAKELNETPVAS